MQDRKWEIIEAPLGFGTSHAKTENAPAGVDTWNTADEMACVQDRM